MHKKNLIHVGAILTIVGIGDAICIHSDLAAVAVFTGWFLLGLGIHVLGRMGASKQS